MVKNKEFDRAFKLGQSFYEQALGFKVIENGTNLVRLGILISTKVSKKAPVRNKIKRQLREIFRQELPLLATGKDVVLVVLRPILDKKYQDIQESLKNGLKKLRLYKK